MPYQSGVPGSESPDSAPPEGHARDRDYTIRDLEGNPISKEEGREIVKDRFFVAEEVRQRLSNRKRVLLNKRGRT